MQCFNLKIYQARRGITRHLVLLPTNSILKNLSYLKKYSIKKRTSVFVFVFVITINIVPIMESTLKIDFHTILATVSKNIFCF